MTVKFNEEQKQDWNNDNCLKTIRIPQFTIIFFLLKKEAMFVFTGSVISVTRRYIATEVSHLSENSPYNYCMSLLIWFLRIWWKIKTNETIYSIFFMSSYFLLGIVVILKKEMSRLITWRWKGGSFETIFYLRGMHTSGIKSSSSSMYCM